jgi:flagellar motor component MotA
MECFIVKDGEEKKAELEDILPLFSDMRIQRIFRDTYRSNISLPFVLAYMSDEMKSLVYRNLLLRIRGRIEKDVKNAEAMYKRDDIFIKDAKARLISFILKNKKWLYGCSERFVWKKAKPKEKIQAVEPPNPVEDLVKKIEEAFHFEFLDLSVWYKITKNDVQNAFAKFQDRKDELQKIRSLTIHLAMLPATTLLFEAGGIEKLAILGVFDGTWPGFLEKYQALKSIFLNVWEGLTEFPLWIRNAVSLRHLHINVTESASIPDVIGDMQSLTEFVIDGYNNEKLKTFPDSIGNLRNLAKIVISNTVLEKLPDTVGDISSLKELILGNNANLASLPDSIGNLKNLEKFTLFSSPMKILPDCIGNLENLTELSLENIENLKCLPDSIGRLKNLVTLNLYGSAIEKLPDTIANCSSLEFVDIRNTNISLIPDFVFSIKNLKRSIEVIPKKHISSYSSFCNWYYTLVETIIRLAKIARPESYLLYEEELEEGLLSFHDELDNFSDGFFKEGIELVVHRTDWKTIQQSLAPKIESEHDHYKKKLMEIALEGILCIGRHDTASDTCIRLAAMVDIKNNPLDTACAKYLGGDNEAFDNIDFKSAMQPEEDREEIKFIERAFSLMGILRREGILGLEKRLFTDGIKERDVFEYGLSLLVYGWSFYDNEKILAMLIAHETDPARKNLALAKRAAVRMFYRNYDPGMVKSKLLAFFEDIDRDC